MGTMMRKSRIIALMMAGAAVLAACHKGEESGSTASAAGGDVKVGILHSLSGTMAISEVTVKNATQMAIDEINAAGGVLGKKIDAVTEDGASDPAIFAQKATKLVSDDGVATVFGGWTSASR